MNWDHRNIKIKTFGTVMTITLVLVAAIVVTASIITMQQTNKVSALWEQYDRVPARKSVVLSHLRDVLGYDGMIHHFKNFILRKERHRAAKTNQLMLEISIALTAYEALGLNDKEDAALKTLVLTMEKYRAAIALAERLVNEGLTSIEIDKRVKIDDAPAVEAMKVLEAELFAARQESSSRLYIVDEQMTIFVSMSAMVTGILLLFLTVSMIWFVRWRLVQPLNNLVEAFNRINLKSLKKMRLPVIEHIEGDELNLVARAGNRFLEASETHQSNRRKAEEKLRISEAHLRSVVETAVDAIITIDGKGRIQSFNTAASSIFNYSEEEVVGKNITLLMPEPDKTGHGGYIRNYLKTGKANIIGIGREVKGRRRDGSVFPMRLGISETLSGGERGFTGIIRDISSEKEAELKIRLSKEAADRANQAKSEFLASMSHELRTPLNAILGFAQFLECNPKDPPSVGQKEYIGLILKSGEHLLQLIVEVLELAKIEAGQLTVLFEDVAVKDVILGCMEIITPRAESRDISIEFQCPGDECRNYCQTVSTDRRRFKQVLLNLLSNAVKYNRVKGSIIIDCQKTTDGMLRISVTDTGNGISEDKQRKLFLPFDRLGREAGEIEGTGIGLTITKQIVTALGGRMGLDSEEGLGSTFWFELPLAEGGAAVANIGRGN